MEFKKKKKKKKKSLKIGNKSCLNEYMKTGENKRSGLLFDL